MHPLEGLDAIATTESNSDDIECVYCLSRGGKIIEPCSCKKVHNQCLTNFVDAGGSKTNCEICRKKYTNFKYKNSLVRQRSREEIPATIDVFINNLTEESEDDIETNHKFNLVFAISIVSVIYLFYVWAIFGFEVSWSFENMEYITKGYVECDNILYPCSENTCYASVNICQSGITFLFYMGLIITLCILPGQLYILRINYDKNCEIIFQLFIWLALQIFLSHFIGMAIILSFNHILAREVGIGIATFLVGLPFALLCIMVLYCVVNACYRLFC